MDSKWISFSHWCTPSETRAEINVSPIGTNGGQYHELRKRIRFCVYSGAAHIQFNPTRDEARALIEALEWALQPAEQTAAEAA